MKVIIFSPQLSLNREDLGLRVSGEAVYVPMELEAPLQNMGVRTADALVSSLQNFPTAVTSHTNLNAGETANAIAGALEVLRPYVDARLFQGNAPLRRGLGAMPPRTGKVFGR
jgi:hypothetical protein